MSNSKYVIEFDRHVRGVARRHQRAVVAVIRGYGKNVIKALKTQPPQTVLENIPLLIPTEPLRDALVELWLDGYVRFAKLTARQLETTVKLHGYTFEIKKDPRIRLAELLVGNPELAAIYQDLMQYFTTTGAARVITIVETYRGIATERIKEALMDITALGLGENEATQLLNRYVEEGWRNANFYAQRIVRTEAHAAANYSSYQTAVNTGARVQKVWRAYLDNKTRPSHVAANGQVQPLDKPFQVGATTLMMPGDPTNTDAGEVVNCRCAVGYIRIKDQYDED